MESRTGQKLVRRVKAETFVEEHLEQYTLLLQFGPRDFQAAAIQEQQSTVEWIEDYGLSEAPNVSAYLTTIQGIIFDNPVLPARFWKRVIVGIKNNHFLQMPEVLLDTENASDYLKFNCRFDPETESVMTCGCLFEGVKTVFSLPTEIKKWVETFYAGIPVEFIHQSAGIISGAARSGEADRSLHLFADRFRLHLTCLSAGAPEYYNQFAIREFNDYVKYLSLVIDTLKLDQKTCPVILWGYLSSSSPHAQEFSRYVSNLRFGIRRLPLKAGAGMEIQDHQFLDLLALPFTSSRVA